jgi:hypothetical protein
MVNSVPLLHLSLFFKRLLTYLCLQMRVVIMLFSLQYFSLLLILFVGLAAGVGLAYMFRQKIDTELHETMMAGFKQYKDNGTMSDVIDDFQSQVN